MFAFLITNEEGWRAIRWADRTDVWDSVKFVPISVDGNLARQRGARHL